MLKEVTYVADDDCPICCVSMKDDQVYETPCGHCYHIQCLTKQFESSYRSRFLCAVCRGDLKKCLPAGSIPDSDLDVPLWGTDIVFMLNQLPLEPRGALRTRVLLAQYINQHEDALHIQGLTPAHRAILIRIIDEGRQSLGETDTSRITAFVEMAEHASQSYNVALPPRLLLRAELSESNFRALSDFLGDPSPHSSGSSFSIINRFRTFWRSLFSNGYTRGRDGFQSPLRQSRVNHSLTGSDRQDSLPWWRFGC